MKTIEITEVDLNQWVNQTKIVDEILLVRKGEQVARLLPPQATAASSTQQVGRPAASVQPLPKFFVAAEGDVMEREIAAYEAQHQALIDKHLGQYVAIHGGDVIDYDDDRSRLRARINANYPNVIVLVRKVESELPGPIHVRSPEMNRIS